MLRDRFWNTRNHGFVLPPCSVQIFRTEVFSHCLEPHSTLLVGAEQGVTPDLIGSPRGVGRNICDWWVDRYVGQLQCSTKGWSWTAFNNPTTWRLGFPVDQQANTEHEQPNQLQRQFALHWFWGMPNKSTGERLPQDRPMWRKIDRFEPKKNLEVPVVSLRWIQGIPHFNTTPAPKYLAEVDFHKLSRRYLGSYPHWNPRQSQQFAVPTSWFHRPPPKMLHRRPWAALQTAPLRSASPRSGLACGGQQRRRSHPLPPAAVGEDHRGPQSVTFLVGKTVT